MDARIRREIRAIGGDSRSSATELLSRGLQLLRAAAETGGDGLAAVANELVRAQPAMAGLRTAAALALGSPEPASAIDEFAARVERAPEQIARHAVNLLGLRTKSGPLHLVTFSKSRQVEATIRLAARGNEVLVSCAEGRPAKEGRDLARALAEAGISVDFYTDAAISVVVPEADAVIVGADAVCGTAFINKVGTHALCALAAASGTVAYVLAGREKILPDDVFESLAPKPGSPHEVWREPGAGVHVRNPYLEVIPLSTVSSVVTDTGVLQSGEIRAAALWK
jgi:translation initiation factor 2B subunit (eIF-2B alpha/beta/delta family)